MYPELVAASPSPPQRTNGRCGRIAILAVAAVLMAEAGGPIGSAVAEPAANPSRQAWAQQYGHEFHTMADMPDVASATPEQRAGAEDLLARTEAGVGKYADLTAARTAGYDIDAGVARAEQRNPKFASLMQAVDAGRMPARMPMLHVMNQANQLDGRVLDPSAPEDLMYEYQGHDAWKLVGVMYTAGEAYPQAPPDPGGPITRWHYHDEGGGAALMMHIFFVPGNDLAHAYALKMDSM